MNPTFAISEDLPEEQKAIRAKCFHPSGTFLEFPAEEVEKSIPERFEKIVRLYPDRIAVKSAGASVTYDQLNRAANRIAWAIEENTKPGVGSVALLLDNGLDVVAAILGTLKAGKFFVPLDPGDPPDRNCYVLGDCRSELLLSTQRNSPLVSPVPHDQTQILNIDDLGANFRDNNPTRHILPKALAYVLYTSGSTGKPKGVMQNHRNLLQQTYVYTNTVRICIYDHLTFLHSYSKGACTPHLFSALLNGATLFPYDPKIDVADFTTYIVREGITIYHSVPSLFREFTARLMGNEDLSRVRIIHLSGDNTNIQDVVRYRRFFPPDSVFVHRLGSSEANTVFIFLVNKNSTLQDNKLPLGTAVDGKTISLLDDNGAPVSFGEIGEIAIKSRYLSPGYWRDPGRTRASFGTFVGERGFRTYRTGDMARRRLDGAFEYVGRKDSLVKIRGYRVELTEIESALRKLATVKEAIVIGREDRADDPSTAPGTRLVAYIVPTSQPAPTVSALRGVLSEKLPDYMIPSNFVFLDSLPLTPNGKIDRRALPEPSEMRPQLNTAFVPPRTPVEAEITKIWSELLGIKPVGIHDHFFELGGHSLLVTRLISRISRSWNIELTSRNVFELPTVAGLAALVDALQWTKSTPAPSTTRLGDDEEIGTI